MQSKITKIAENREISRKNAIAVILMQFLKMLIIKAMQSMQF